MSLSKEIDKLFEELLNKEEEMDEVSTTANVAGYQTPYAFVDKDDEKSKKKAKRAATNSTGYKLVDEKKSKRSKHKDIMAEIYGLNYKSYKNDSSMSPKQKVNGAIREVAKKMLAVERIVNRNIKLKTEAGVDSGQYWKSTRTSMKKIYERMIRVANKLRELSA